MTPGPRPGSPRARMFIALEAPDTLLDSLVAWRDRAFAGRDEVRLLPRSSLHVTLVFLGYQYERDIPRIAELSLDSPGNPFQLRIQGLVGVPRGRPRLYALSLEDPGNRLSAWQGTLSERLCAAGLYRPEKRPFWPHLTVARMRRRDAKGGPAPALPQPLARPFRAERLTLYRSTLRRTGAIYEPLAARPL